MHEKQIDFQTYMRARDVLTAAAAGKGLPKRSEWHVGYQRWWCYFVDTATPAVYAAQDLRDSTYTYWQDEPPVLLPRADSYLVPFEATQPQRKATIPQPGEPFELQIDVYAGTWRREEWQGDERIAFEVTEVSAGTWQFVCHCYYGAGWRFEITITQPFDRAVRTVIAALRADTLLEDNPVADPVVTARPL